METSDGCEIVFTTLKFEVHEGIEREKAQIQKPDSYFRRRIKKSIKNSFWICY